MLLECGPRRVSPHFIPKIMANAVSGQVEAAAQEHHLLVRVDLAVDRARRGDGAATAVVAARVLAAPLLERADRSC